MKIEDILRIAYNKTLKDPGCLYSFEGMTEEQAKSLVGSDFKYKLMDNILILAYKRRPLLKSAIDNEYMGAIIQELNDRGVPYTASYSHLDNRAEYLLELKNCNFELYYDAGNVSINPFNFPIFLTKPIPASDLVQYLLGVNDLLKDYPSLLDQLWKNNIKVKKSQELIFAAAKVVIKEINLPPGVSISISSADYYHCDTRILCIVTQNDYPFPPYHKSCRSTLDTLKEDILKTLSLVTQYKFRGYVEDCL